MKDEIDNYTVLVTVTAIVVLTVCTWIIAGLMSRI